MGLETLMSFCNVLVNTYDEFVMCTVINDIETV